MLPGLSTLPLLLLLQVLEGEQSILGFPWRGDENFQKADISPGMCVVQINEPCYSNPKIKFELFTKSNSERFILDLGSMKMKASMDFNAALPIKVVIHGFGARSLVDPIVQAYIEKGTYNVLVVDWEDLSRRPCYLTAALNTRQVGRCGGLALALLRPKGHVHIVGFSLGAHVAGHMSRFLEQHLGRRANRISGLDPALPLYATPIDWKKLDKTDADFVDVIHTNAGVFGKLEPSGHSDFYVNGIGLQPGCSTWQVGNPALCSHGRATELFAESIRHPDSFQGTPCPSFWYYAVGYCSTRIWPISARMGDKADPKTRGIYLVQTSDRPPYSLDLLEIV
ncbi:Lipase [Nesidiocoris tenuis]|uniref:Lipase n=1 Tax=Nesidiocoris tenuis TaxID=355587 RepID=A0ABN7ARU1_9HEMI|nr:Lipase [Nesidiocoris tenuis]